MDHAEQMEARMADQIASLEAIRDQEDSEAKRLMALLADSQERTRAIGRAIEALGRTKKAVVRSRPRTGATASALRPSDTTMERVLAVLTEEPKTVKQWTALVGSLSDSAVRDAIYHLRSQGRVRACGKVKPDPSAPHASETYALMPSSVAAEVA